MTEAEWLACTDPTPMLEFLRGKASDGKLQLLACACCRSVWQRLSNERSRNGVVAAENYADGRVTLAEYGQARDASLGAFEDASGGSESAELGHAKWHAATALAHCADMPFCTDRSRDASEDGAFSGSQHGSSSAAVLPAGILHRAGRAEPRRLR